MYSYMFVKRIVLSSDICLKAEQIFIQSKNYEKHPELCLKIHLRNLQFLGLQNGDLFLYTRKKNVILVLNCQFQVLLLELY